MGTAPLAATFVREGMRQRRFPAIDFREGEPGRVAHLAGSRWSVWMIVDLVREYAGDIVAAAGQMERPQALVKMALAYTAAYPEEIEAGLKLHAERDFAGLQRVIPTLEQL